MHIPIILFVLFIVLSFITIKPIFLAIFVGALLAYIFNPLYQIMVNKTNKSDRKKFAVALFICGLVLLILVVPAIFIVKTLVKESYVLFLLGKQKLVTGLFSNCSNYFCEVVKDLGQNQEVNFQIQEILRSATNWVIQKGSNFLISVPKMLLNIFVTFFAMFYFLKDGDIFMKRLADFLSMKERKYLFIIKRLKEIVHGIIYGNLLIALLQGALGALGFFIFGISSPLFWGFLMIFLALIPALGTGFVWFPAAMFLFLDGIFQNSNTLILKGVGLFIYSVILVSSVDNVLKPKLVSDKAKVHPAIILVGIIGGIFVFGMWGVILGPLILSLTSVFIDAFILHKL